MKNELFCAVKIGCEVLNPMPEALDYAIQDITHKLADRIVSELEKGELICSLQDVEKRPFYALNCVEIRRKVTLERLVRCENCKYWNECGFGMRDDMCHCSRIDYWTNADFFCADGKEKSDE